MNYFLIVINLGKFDRKAKDQHYDPISFEEFDKNDDWILEEEPLQLTIEEEESMRRSDEEKREEIARGKHHAHDDDIEIAINWDYFEDELFEGRQDNNVP